MDILVTDVHSCFSRPYPNPSRTTASLITSVQDVTHVFLDEVHERSVETDFLLIVLKDVLKRCEHCEAGYPVLRDGRQS